MAFFVTEAPPPPSPLTFILNDCMLEVEVSSGYFKGGSHRFGASVAT